VQNMANFYIDRICRSLGIFTAIFVLIYTSFMEIYKRNCEWVFFSEHSVVALNYTVIGFL